MPKLKCQGRTCTQEDRQQEWESFKEEMVSLFKVHCCLVDEGRWPWWAVSSSLIHYLLFLHWIHNRLGTEGYMFWEVINRNGVQNPVICPQFCLPIYLSSVLLLAVWKLASSPSPWRTDITSKWDIECSIFRILPENFLCHWLLWCRCLGADPPTPHHGVARQSYCRNFLCFCPNGKCPKWS